MRYLLISLLIVLISGCLWKVPLSKPQGIAVDSQLVGDWKCMSDDTEEGVLRIMPFTETELIMAWLDGEDLDESELYRAYPIRIKGREFLQLQVLPDSNFLVLQYEFRDSLVIYKILNEDLFPDSINSTPQMKKHFKKQINNPKLFLTLDSLSKVE